MEIICIHTEVKRIPYDFGNLLYGFGVGDYAGRCMMSIYNHSLIRRTQSLLKLTQFFMMNFHIELSLIDAVLRSKKMKDCLGVDSELCQKKVRGLIEFIDIRCGHSWVEHLS